MRKLLFSLLLTGCSLDTRWDVGTEFHATVRGVTEFQDLPAWRGMVADAVAEWTEAIGPGCDFPFTMTESMGKPVTLVSREDWEHDYVTVGMQYLGSIEVRDRQFLPNVRGTLLHELGHAMGLEHRATGEWSVMAEGNHPASVTEIDAADIRAELDCP